MGTDASACSACGVTRPPEPARYCGNCGAGLVTTDRRRRVRRQRTGVVRPRPDGGRLGVPALVVVVLGFVVLVVALVTSGPLSDPGVAPGGADDGLAGDTEVVGIGPETRPDGPGGDTEAGSDGGAPAGDVAPTDPGPLRCAPDGCDAWQADVPSGPFAASDGVLYLIDDDRLVARDGRFGTVRWEVELEGSATAVGTGAPGDAPSETAVIRADPGGVLVATSHQLVRHDRDGAERWRIGVPGWEVWDAATVGDRYVVTRSRSPGGGVPFGRVGVLDLDDGGERWTRQVTQVHGLTDELVLTGGPRGSVAAFELHDGSLRWERSVSQQTAVRVVGPLVHLEALFPQANPRGRLIEASTGTTPGHLDGAVLHAPTAVDDLLVTILRDPDASDRVRVVAVSSDGAVAWNRRLLVITGPDRSFLGPVSAARVLDPDDGSRIEVEAGTTRTSLRTADGAFLGRLDAPDEAPGDDARADAPDEAPGDDAAADARSTVVAPDPVADGWRTVGEGIAVRDHDEGLQIRGPEGTVVVVRGTEPHLVATDPLVVSDGARLLGLQVRGRS